MVEDLHGGGRCVTIPHLCLDVFVFETQEREYLCMHVPFDIAQLCIFFPFLNKPFFPLIVFSLHLCQPSHAAVVVILFPSAGRQHRVVSSLIKPVLKWVKFQAITRIVRD